jgi:hypothetical protein
MARDNQVVGQGCVELAALLARDRPDLRQIHLLVFNLRALRSFLSLFLFLRERDDI